jgi:hypothetical protein
LNKIESKQILYILTGIILIITGYYLITLHVDSIITLVVTTTGVVLLISAFRYKQWANTKKLEGEERKAYIRSPYFIVTMIGSVLFFASLGTILLVNYFFGSPIFSLGFVGLAFIGVLVMFVGIIIKAAKKK